MGGVKQVPARLLLTGFPFLLQLPLEALRHIRGRWAGQTEKHLYRVVDKPLQGRQRTDHQDPGTQTLPQT